MRTYYLNVNYVKQKRGRLMKIKILFKTILLRVKKTLSSIIEKIDDKRKDIELCANIATVIALVFLVTQIQSGNEQTALVKNQIKALNEQTILLKNQSLVTNSLSTSQLADRALWENTIVCGDYTSYENLITCYDQIREENKEFSKQIMKNIKRIKDDYKTSILLPKVDKISAVCQAGTMQGVSCLFEPIEGFSASNVIEQLDITKYQRCTTRARAISILRNIETAPDKDKVNIRKVLKMLVYIMKEDPSLLVRKLALDRYSQFTDFSPKDIFDFERAINDWEQREESKN